ncbi:MAG: EamA family transporter [Burkholderiaceae bacterium]
MFFTIGLSLMLMGEKVRAYQVVGLLLAVAGLGVIALHLNASVTALGLGLVLLAGFFWACANVVVKSIGQVNMLHFVVWSSLFAVPPLFALSCLLEGTPSELWQTLQGASALTWASGGWRSRGQLLFGFAAWNWLLSRHPAALVTPMALLVPVFGMSASALALGEPAPWKLGAGAGDGRSGGDRVVSRACATLKARPA